MRRTSVTDASQMGEARPANSQHPTANSPEADLVARAREDPRAFAALYDRYVEPLYRYAYRRTGSHPAAEDLVSATFHRALESLESYEWRGLSFGAWLYRIAGNLAADGSRRAKAASLDGLHADGFEAADSGAEAPGDALLDREEVDAAWAAVALLPPMQRRAVVLRFARGLSNAETGAAIGRSEAATKQLVYRAIRSVRARLEKEGML
jgi:RNA polymerase sigma-70 factor (ECF subfamily)